MEEDKRIISSIKKTEDVIDYTFRPLSLDDFIGQEGFKENLKVYITAAKQRNEPLDHILLYGPPGLGKTTLANIISKEMNVNIKSIQAPLLEKTGDVAAYLASLSEHDVLFIDEIHRLKASIEEILYSAMEDYKIDIMVGQGAGASSFKITLPKFTLIGATTRAGMITTPLYDRFGIIQRLDLYDVKLLKQIVLRTSDLMKLKIDMISADEIAKRSRGTPRVVNRIMRRVRDFAQVHGDGKIDIVIAKMCLEKLDIDDMGFDTMDRRLLMTLIEKFDGGPVGVETLAVSIGEDSETIEDVYEPYLIQQGFIQRTPRGRMATSTCYKYFGFKSKPLQSELFDMGN